MTRQSFEIAVEEKSGERGDAFPFHLSDAKDHPFNVYPPTENQIMLLMAISARGPGEMDMREMGRAFNLLLSMLDDDGRRYIEGRIERGDLNFQAVFQIFEKLLEVMSGRPTGQSSDSSSPPSTTGKPSAGPARRAASTRSKSPARRSATTSTRSASTTSGSPAKAGKS